MTWTESDLDAIKEAIKTGALRVKYADKEVEYRSLEELLKIKDLIEESLGQKKKTTRVFTNFSKGLK